MSEKHDINPSESMSLDDLRQAIDTIDDKILSMIHQRAALAAAVGERKISHGDSPFYVPSREAKIIRRLLQRNNEQAAHSHLTKIPDNAVHGIYREIIGACLALEHPLSIAYLGPEGTFSHTAATRQFGATALYQPYLNLEQVFDAVESGRATYAVVPVENAYEGAVAPALDLLAEMGREIQICAEVQLSIHHHLFSYAESLQDIKWVMSHPQPLGQCRNWLQANLPNASLLDSTSTVHAAKLIEQARAGQASTIDWRHAAAIGPYSIVDQVDIPLLQRNVEDHHQNTTRFYVIGQHDSPPSGEDKTALVMMVKDEPGALNRLLSAFSQRNIGLTRIESRPSKKKLWEYVFFVDILGHRDEQTVTDALQEIEQIGATVKVLGSYPVSKKL